MRTTVTELKTIRNIIDNSDNTGGLPAIPEVQEKVYPRMTDSNNKVHSVQITTYAKDGQVINSKYISGNILTEYTYNSNTNTFKPIPRVTINKGVTKVLEGYNEHDNNPSYNSYEYVVPEVIKD